MPFGQWGSAQDRSGRATGWGSLLLSLQERFERTTIRAVAAAASVDPALVTQYFGSKRELFSQVVQALPAPLTATDTEALVEQLPASLGLKLGGLPEGTLAMMRSMLTGQAAADQIRVALGRQIAGVGAALPAGEDPELRAALVVTALLASPAAISSSAGASLCEAPADRIAALLRPAIKALVGPSSE